MNSTPGSRLVLRDLPLPVRLVLALFLVSVGTGYAAALVQIHFQQARPGQLLPDSEDIVRTFSGVQGQPQSKIEQLITADETRPFNGQGTMRPAFTTKSSGWKSAIKATAKELKTKDLAEAETQLRQERDAEAAALLAWIHAGAAQQDYEKDHFPLPPELASAPITSDYLVNGPDDKPVHPRALKIQTLLNDRCVRCHDPERQGQKEAQFPLNTYERLKPYVHATASGGGMSLTKLAQTTHLHLLSFAMLYGLTGVIFSLSCYPGWLRAVIAPWPLFAQLLEIACWWLARSDPIFARAIVVLGGLVAIGLMLHIVLGLVSLFGRRGRVVLVVLFALAVGGFVFVKQRIVDPYLSQEAQSATTNGE